MSESEPLDPRSTYRKRARDVLLKEGKPFKCEGCGHTPDGVDEDGKIVDITKLSRSNNLDVNHQNKDISDNDSANLEWLCRTCHYEHDRATEKGVSPVEDDLYGPDFMLGLVD